MRRLPDRQTIAEWHKLKVCDLDEVQGSACKASAKMKSLLAPGIKKSPKRAFLVDRQGLEPWTP